MKPTNSGSMRRGPAARRWLMAVAVALLAGVTSGCGNGLSSVSGTVMVNGSPIEGGSEVRGTVYFYPEGGTGAPAVGLLDGEGRYTIRTGSKKGVAPGTYSVCVRATRIIPPKQQGEAPSGRPITPGKFADPNQSGLRAEVGPGSNEIDFDLEFKVASRRRR